MTSKRARRSQALNASFQPRCTKCNNQLNRETQAEKRKTCDRCTSFESPLRQETEAYAQIFLDSL